MAITTDNVPIQESTVLAMLEERTEPMYQFRRAFRDYDATGEDSEEINFPTPEDDFDRDSMAEIEELSNYPRYEVNYDDVSAVYAKYGFEVVISDEGIRFGRVDAELDAQTQMMEAEERALDAQAYELLAAQNNDITIGNGTDPLSYDYVVDAYVEAANQEYNPGDFEIYQGPYAFGNIAKDDNFNRATEQGDALARNGQLGEMFGVTHALSNTGDLTTDAFLVDTSKYGYEVTWEPTDVNAYREEDVDGWVYKINGYWGFAVTDPQACIYIDAGDGS